MPVPASISVLSTTPASNSPSGAESPSVTDDYFRTAFAFIKTLDNEKVALSGSQTIAGTKTFSSTIVGSINGNAATASNAIGVGQTWQDLSASRTHSTNYQNTTGRTIAVAIRTSGSGGSRVAQVSADASTWFSVGGLTVSTDTNAYFEVPPSHYYRINGATGAIAYWSELR